MIVEFRVKNFCCLRDEQVLSFVPTTDKTLEESNIYDTDVLSEPHLLRTAAIYGANASGKSTVIMALQTMLNIVCIKFIEGTESFIPTIPFLLDNESQNNPTSFELTFIDNGFKYQYGISCTRMKIIEEYLFKYNTKRKSTLFDRLYDNKSESYIYKFGKDISTERITWRKATSDKVCFLSTAAQLNSKIFLPIWLYLKEKYLIINKDNKPHMWFILSKLYKNIKKQERICSFLRSADISIDSIKINKIPIRNNTKYTIFDDLTNEYILYFNHKKIDNTQMLLPSALESSGTLRLFIYLNYMFDILDKGGVFIVDEIDASLHPMLVQHIIKLFQSKNNNSHGAQLLVSTHDVYILQNDPPILRNDQIWFIEKNGDQASELYSLSDFTKLKENNYLKYYMHGKLGGVPAIREWEDVYEG